MKVAREPMPGEDWTTARCANPRPRRGHAPWLTGWTCCFCGNEIEVRRSFVAHLGNEHAHYECAPGLGVVTDERGDP